MPFVSYSFLYEIGYVVDRVDPFVKKTPKKKNKSQGSPKFRNPDVVELQPLLSLDEARPSEQEGLFVKKLAQCCVVFDFMDPTLHLTGKEIKTAALHEILYYLSSGVGEIRDAVYPDIFKMISVNLFRTLPPREAPEYEVDDDDPTLEASWPHLSLVYEIFLTFLESPEFRPAVAKPLIDRKFLHQLIELFDTEDPRERDFLKMVLHRTYAHFMEHRAYIRSQINNVLLGFVYETEQFNGVFDLLHLMGSIINGLNLPLKQDHKQFLFRVLMPLHKPRSLYQYHTRLVQCVAQFIEKDPSLMKQVMQSLLRYWPKTSTKKEVMFLNEIEEFTKVYDFGDNLEIQEALFKQISKSLSSHHFQVAERALILCTNDSIKASMAKNLEIVMPIIIPALYQIITAHWNQTVIALVFRVFKMLLEMNNKLFGNLIATLVRHTEKGREKETELLCRILMEMEMRRTD